MTLNRDDFAILDKFEFDIQPVAVNYLVKPPENITRIDQKMTLCEVLVKAQKGYSFYSDPEDHACGAGTYVLGQSDIEDQFIDGEYGAGLGVFCDRRAAGRLYHYIPKIARHVVNYVAFSPFGQASFRP